MSEKRMIAISAKEVTQDLWRSEEGSVEFFKYIIKDRRRVVA